MNEGLDNILSSIRLKPDNNNLVSRYVQLATETISSQGVEAIARLVDVYVEIYPKKALEIANSLLVYARHEELDEECEKIAMLEVVKCFNAMGKVEEALRVSNEIDKLFSIESPKVLPIDSYSSDEVQSLNKTISVSNPKISQPLDLGSLQDLGRTSIISPSEDDSIENTSLDQDSTDKLETNSGIDIELPLERDHIQHTDSEAEEKLREKVKIHLPLNDSELMESYKAMDDNVVPRALGPNLLTGSSEISVEHPNSRSDQLWGRFFDEIDFVKMKNESEMIRFITDSYKSRNISVTELDVETISEFLWSSCKNSGKEIMDFFFLEFSPRQIRDFFYGLNLNETFIDFFTEHLDQLFVCENHRRTNYLLSAFLQFDDSLSWARFIYKQHVKLSVATSQLPANWEEKEGVAVLFERLSKRRFPALSKISV